MASPRKFFNLVLIRGGLRAASFFHHLPGEAEMKNWTSKKAIEPQRHSAAPWPQPKQNGANPKTPWMVGRLREEIQRKDAKTLRRKGLGQRHRVRAWQPRTPSALGRKKTISMSKLKSPASLLPQHASRASGLSSEFVPTRENRTLPTRSAVAGEARSRKGGDGRGKLAFRTMSRLSGTTKGSRRTHDTAPKHPFASLRLGDFAFLSFCFFSETT